MTGDIGPETGGGGIERESGDRAYGGYDPIKRRPPTTLDTLRTYGQDSRSCSRFHSRQFRATDEDEG